jgi:hypothetical protein
VKIAAARDSKEIEVLRMKPIQALLTLLPLALLSSAAGPCTDQNLGSIDQDEDAGADASVAADAGTDAVVANGNDAALPSDAPAIYTGTTCTVDDDCVGTNYYKDVATQADCYCNDTCASHVLNVATSQKYEAQWHAVCDAWPGRAQCFIPPCVPPEPVGCEHNQCTSLSRELTTGSLACDPLAPRPLAIALASVLAVGKHADGTLYVIDEPRTSDYRVFVSAGTTLQRQRLAGTGEVNQGGLTVTILTVGEGASQFTLQLEVRGNDRRMAVLRGEAAGKGFVIGQQGDLLQVMGTEALAGLTVANLPGTIVTEYQAQLADGRRILVTRPQDDGSYSDFRLYLGPAGQVAERRVSDVQRARSGPTTITFMLDFQAASVHFGSTLAPGDEPWAKINMVMQPLTVLSPAAPTTGLSFLCRAP